MSAYHPAKLFPSFVGSVGLVAFSPSFTSCGFVPAPAHVPPSKLNVTWCGNFNWILLIYLKSPVFSEFFNVYSILSSELTSSANVALLLITVNNNLLLIL